GVPRLVSCFRVSRIVPKLGSLENNDDQASSCRAFFPTEGTIPKLGTIRSREKKEPRAPSRGLTLFHPRAEGPEEGHEPLPLGLAAVVHGAARLLGDLRLDADLV